MNTEAEDVAMTQEGRALLTDSERAVLSGETDANTNYEYKVKSLVRNRVRKKFGRDMEVLEENFPEVYEMVHGEVCDSD